MLNIIREISYDREEPVENLIMWLYEEGSFSPIGKVENGETYYIVNDYLGTPTQAFNTEGELIWRRELDIYGKVRYLEGEEEFIPFRYQGQYYDKETQLCYNRFRYYAPETGLYISQDPIGLAGNNPNFYAYVFDSNAQVDVFGLILIGSKSFKMPKIGWNFNNMPKIDGFQLHHIIPRSLSKHKVLRAINFDINKIQNLIYLPEEFEGYNNRSAHKGYSGDHSKYNKMMKSRLIDILKTKSKDQYEQAIKDLIDEIRQGLRSGTIKCR